MAAARVHRPCQHARAQPPQSVLDAQGRSSKNGAHSVDTAETPLMRSASSDGQSCDMSAAACSARSMPLTPAGVGTSTEKCTHRPLLSADTGASATTVTCAGCTRMPPLIARAKAATNPPTAPQPPAPSVGEHGSSWSNGPEGRERHARSARSPVTTATALTAVAKRLTVVRSRRAGGAALPSAEAPRQLARGRHGPTHSSQCGVRGWGKRQAGCS